MNQLNQIIIEGNVVKQPELREPVPGFKTCSIPIAVHRFFRDKNGEGKEEVSYVDIEAFNGMAEYASDKAVKGRAIRVVGRLKQDRWKNKEDKWESRMSVVAEHIEYKPVPTSEKNQENAENEKASAAESSVTEAMKLAEQAAYSEEEKEAVCF